MNHNSFTKSLEVKAVVVICSCLSILYFRYVFEKGTTTGERGSLLINYERTTAKWGLEWGVECRERAKAADVNLELTPPVTVDAERAKVCPKNQTQKKNATHK